MIVVNTFIQTTTLFQTSPTPKRSNIWQDGWDGVILPAQFPHTLCDPQVWHSRPGKSCRAVSVPTYPIWHPSWPPLSQTSERFVSPPTAGKLRPTPIFSTVGKICQFFRTRESEAHPPFPLQQLKNLSTHKNTKIKSSGKSYQFLFSE